MTNSQLARRTGTSSPVRRTLSRSLRALRNLHNEELYAWERFFRTGLPPYPRTQAPAAAHGGYAQAATGSPVPADAGHRDQAA